MRVELAKTIAQSRANMKTIGALVLSLALLSTSSLVAASKGNSPSQSLAGVPAAEMPAKAAELVKAAKARDRRTATADIVNAAVDLNPAATPQVVGAIAKATPSMAPLAAGIAAAQLPKQASVIARAAAAAAPAEAGKIAAAVCRAVPSDYRAIAIAVGTAVPSANKAVLESIASVLPNLKPGIESAMAGYGGQAPSVALILDSARTPDARLTPVPALVAASPAGPVVGPQSISTPTPAPAPAPRPPAVGPPFIPLSNTPTNVTSGSSGDVPTGGRNYAAP